MNTAAQQPERNIHQHGAIVDPRWVVAARLCIAVTALLSVTAGTFLGSEETAARVRFLFTPVAVLFVLNAASALWLQRRRVGTGFYLAHVLLDVPLVTGVVYITGGSASPFVFLYLLLAMIASSLVSQRAGLGVAALSAGMHSCLIWCIGAGFLASADGIQSAHIPVAGLLIQSLGVTTGMVLVVLGTSFLRSRLISSYALVEESRESLREITSEQDRLLEEFPGGIITTDLECAVRSMNQAARSLLQISAVAESNLQLATILMGEKAKRRTAAEWLADELETTEIELFSSEPGRSKTIEAQCRPMRDRLGGISGLAFFLLDVTELRTAEEKLQLQERMVRLLAEQQHREPMSAPLGELIGESPIMQKVFEIIQRVSGSDATVLVTGESGTGKELVAKAIHFNSPRSNEPFVAVNCGAIPENLIESELFGHKKGSFTGADSDTIGLIRQASGGTLFLDEIGELPLLMQAKILRCLQEKTVRPVGATNDIPFDVRIIAATNRNIKREVEVGKFREDLYYRLNVIGIHLPPLRERRNDLPLLMKSILHRLAKGKPTPVISPQATQMLASYHYPGNVRELENILERALVLGGDVIVPEHLPDLASSSGSGVPQSRTSGQETVIIENTEVTLPIDLDQLLSTLEQRYLELALTQSKGAKKQAASLLGMNFRSFRYRLQKFGMAQDSNSPEY